MNMEKIVLNNDWDDKLKIIWNSPNFENFMAYIEKEYNEKTIYPKKEDIFNALKITSFKNTKVVIIGQDPYHEPGQAHGLSFSVQDNVKIPASLKNIYKELNSDLGIEIPLTGNLTKWAEQGVLLLNSSLTVVKGKANSHKNIGWNRLTDYVIKKLNEKDTPVVFILWGNDARAKKELITNSNHLIIESAHPSPLSASRGFFGSKPFSKANDFLESKGLGKIDWSL